MAGIYNYFVNAARILAGAVTEAKIGTGAVTAGKIGAGAVTAGKLATETKRMLITDAMPYDAQVYRITMSYGAAWEFANNQDGYLGFTFQVPYDWISGGTIKILYYEDGSLANGNVIWQVYMKQAIVGEDWTHSASDLANSVAIPVDSVATRLLTTSLTLAVPVVGENVIVRFHRDGNNASDTFERAFQIIGVVLEYTGRV